MPSCRAHERARLAGPPTLLGVAFALGALVALLVPTRREFAEAPRLRSEGGSLAYLAAARLPFACAVVYYGKVSGYLEQKPRCPIMFHYGARDPSIPAADVEQVRARLVPPALLYVYEDAGHGFNRDVSDSYQPAAAALARSRTLEFLARHVIGGEKPAE